MLEAADFWDNFRYNLPPALVYPWATRPEPTIWWNPDYDNAFLASMNIAPVIAERRLLG